jgi:hypothetical protein
MNLRIGYSCWSIYLTRKKDLSICACKTIFLNDDIWILIEIIIWLCRHAYIKEAETIDQKKIGQCKIDQNYFIYAHLKRMIMNDHVSFCRRHSLTRNRNQSISTNMHASFSWLYHMPTYTCVVMYEYASRYKSSMKSWFD